MRWPPGRGSRPFGDGEDVARLRNEPLCLDDEVFLLVVGGATDVGRAQIAPCGMTALCWRHSYS
jgi:hypothetical protein